MSDHLLLDEPFIAVNASLIRATGSASRAIVLQALWFARDRATGRTTLTMEAVADRTGLSRRTVERATTWARDAGVLTRDKVARFDHTSVWTVSPAVLATLTASNTPNGENEDATLAGSDPATLAGSSPKNVKNSPPTEGAAATHQGQAIAADVYERTGKAVRFPAVLGIARWALTNRPEVTHREVADAMVAIHTAGKPITQAILAQVLDGHLALNGASSARAARDREAFGPQWADGTAVAGWEAVAGPRNGVAP